MYLYELLNIYRLLDTVKINEYLSLIRHCKTQQQRDQRLCTTRHENMRVHVKNPSKNKKGFTLDPHLELDR